MLQQIKDLVRETHVQEALRSAGTRAEATRVLIDAGARKGCHFVAREVAQVLDAVMGTGPQELSHEEATLVAGALRNTGGGGGGGPAPSTTRMFPECIPYP